MHQWSDASERGPQLLFISVLSVSPPAPRTLTYYSSVALIKIKMDGTSKNDTQPIKTTTFNGWAASLVPGTAETVTASWAYGPWGTAGQRQKTHLLLASSETEEMLHANERTVTINRPGNPLRRYDTNFIPGNKRTEDAHAVDILSKDDLEYLVTEQAPGIVRSFWERWSDVKISGGHSQVQNEVANGSKDMVMASVFDGHNDTHVLSDLLSKTVHASLAHSLRQFGTQPWKTEAGSGLHQRRCHSSRGDQVAHD